MLLKCICHNLSAIVHAMHELGIAALWGGRGEGVVSHLTVPEQAHVRTALRFLRARCGSWQPVIKALRIDRRTLYEPPSPTLPYRVAGLAKVGVDDVLSGRFPDPRHCPHCGHVREEAAD